jgi:hypothetical protein
VHCFLVKGDRGWSWVIAACHGRSPAHHGDHLLIMASACSSFPFSLNSRFRAEAYNLLRTGKDAVMDLGAALLEIRYNWEE